MEQQPPLDEATAWTPLPPPLAVAQKHWPGLPVSLIPLCGDGDYRDIGIPSAVIAVARSGRGQRWYSSGARRGSLYTVPGMVEVIESGMYFDRFQQRGEPGEVVEVKLPPGSLTRWLHDSAHSFVLRTQHEVFDSRLRDLLNLLWDEAEQGSPNGPLVAEGLSMALLGVLMADYAGEARMGTRPGRFSAEQRVRLMDFIASNLHRNLCLESMSNILAMSPFHFSRLFRETFHQSPHAFVVERRLDAACIAMRTNANRPLAEIALAAGFSSQAHFSETFRRKIGTTPGRWRKGLR